ncbi:MAG: arginine repressor [Angelakisella sp.]|nr:arginine repressor [Angelakisella sp.]
MKSKRHSKILEIIDSHIITTQEELQSYLEAEGITATQATISRDIKELRLIKTLSPTGSYYYTVTPEKTSNELPVNINSVFMESIRTVDYAGNFVVIKCYTGMANAVCATIDTGSWNGLIGSLAGDDTIFLLMRNEHCAQEFCVYIRGVVESRR